MTRVHTKHISEALCCRVRIIVVIPFTPSKHSVPLLGCTGKENYTAGIVILICYMIFIIIIVCNAI